MDQDGRQKGVGKDTQGLQPKWLQDTQFIEKGEIKTESGSKKEKDPADFLVWLHQENQNTNQGVANTH